MPRSIDNAITIAKWLAGCAKADAFRPGAGGQAAAIVRQKVSNAYTNSNVKHLGAGYFSVVFTMAEFGEDVVVKACVDPKEIGFVYLAYCKAHPAKHLPVVYHVERMFTPSGSPVGYVAVLKKLRPLNTKGCQEFCNLGYIREYVDAEVRTKGTLGEAIAHVHDVFGKLAQWDLHGENVMQDEHGTVIITDPITKPVKDGLGPGGKPSALLTGMMRGLGLPEAA